MSVFKNYFYHDLTRKYQLVFGSIFQGIQVKRLNTDGTTQSIQTVPVIQSAKEKFVQRVLGDVDPDMESDGYSYAHDRRRVSIQLPMIAYEMVDMQYDGVRKIAKSNYMRIRREDSSNLSDKIYSPCPYILTFEVNIAAKTQSDMLQIIEQLLPAFTPDVNITLKGITDVEYDVPITFQGLFRNDTYDGSFEDRRQLIWTLNFTMKAFYFTPINRKNIILNVNSPIYHIKDDDNLEKSQLIETFYADETDLSGRWEKSDE